MGDPIEPEIIDARSARGLNLTGAQLCVNCYPIQRYAIFTWHGMSLCETCFTPQRKRADLERDYWWQITMRDYKKIWGEEPVQDAEVG